MTLLTGFPRFRVDLTRDFRGHGILAQSLKHVQTQVVNAGRAANPPDSESHQYCRTSKRISAYG